MTLNLREVRILDGAWGTELQRRGLPAGASPELWNRENPGAVESVARGYVEAGSEIILTNTFGANRYVLARYNAAERTKELAEAGVAISRNAAGTAVQVFASAGPTGSIVMMGDVDQDAVVETYAETAVALARGGADAIVLETFNELAELSLAFRGVKDGCDLPIVVSMSFAAGPDGTATIMGNRPEDLARMAEDCGADAVGANCGIGPDTYVKVARRLASATTLPVWIKPNAGSPQIGPNGMTQFPIGPQEFASYAPQLVESGARFVGGCCGTTPDHVRAIVAILRNTLPKSDSEHVDEEHCG